MAGVRKTKSAQVDLKSMPPWRRVLFGHATDLRKSILAGDGIAGQSRPLDRFSREVIDKALGPLASEAIRIVEAFTIGASTVETGERAGRTVAGGAGLQDAQFNSRLGIVLNAVEPPPGVAAEASGDPSPTVIQSDLWQLLYRVRESAEMAYSRELNLVELDRRILFLLHNAGPLTPAEVSSSVGVDKAQVSRSIKRLLEIDMIGRGQLRAPLKLTSRGQLVSQRLLKLAELRNRELTFDVGDDELAAFFSVIGKLLDQAVLLYDQERRLSQGVEPTNYPRPGAAVESESRSGDRIVLDRTRIISPLMTLSSYFSRSGSLMFKRLTGLSSFEAWVLNEIGLAAPVEWGALVERLDRDHSQAGRTITGLVARDLVVREGKPGRRNGCFSPTKEGLRLYQVIQDASRQRSSFLMSPLSQPERAQFLATFDKIKRNAIVQLERERAFREMG